MKIRASAAGTDARAAGNTFIAVDDLENRLGSCEVRQTSAGETMPNRPCEIRIQAEGDLSARHQLLGTALTRAMVLAKESGVNARIYAECAPGDEEEMELYRSIGLIDDDALVRMRRRAVAGPSVVRLPEGCALVHDRLEDAQERAYFEKQGRAKIEEHARDFIRERLAPAEPRNDGKQTPWRGHPVFIAQHATGCCCRGCLSKWHHIPPHRALREDEQRYIVSVLMCWIDREMKA